MYFPSHSSGLKAVCYHPSLPLSEGPLCTDRTTLGTTACSNVFTPHTSAKGPSVFLRSHESPHVTETWKDSDQRVMDTGSNSSLLISHTQLKVRKPLHCIPGVQWTTCVDFTQPISGLLLF